MYTKFTVASHNTLRLKKRNLTLQSAARGDTVAAAAAGPMLDGFTGIHLFLSQTVDNESVIFILFWPVRICAEKCC